MTVRQRGGRWGVNPCEDRDVGEVTRYCRGVARSVSGAIVNEVCSPHSTVYHEKKVTPSLHDQLAV